MCHKAETRIHCTPRELYPRMGPPWFETGHLPYIQAVTATLIARGVAVSMMRLPPQPFDPAARTRTAEIQLAPQAWLEQFPTSQVPFTLSWSETHGWNYMIGNAANIGMSFGPGEDTVLRSRGLGPHVWLAADPHHVADAVQELLAGTQFEPVGWTGRDADLQDVTLESALAAYRQHPGAVALHGRHEQYLTSRDVLLDLPADLLAAIAGDRGDTVSAALDMRAAQVRVSATRYEISAVPEGSVSPREAAVYSAFVEPADTAAKQWVVLAGRGDVPVYLTADGQETGERQTYDLDTALQVARYGSVQRREGLFSLTADQLTDARSGTVIAQAQRPSAGPAAAASAWPQPVRQALASHATRQNVLPGARPASTAHERREHGAER